MRFAYADPPYIGQARKHYGSKEVDHAALIDRLVTEFPDGWALSCSSPSLRYLLPLCPQDARISPWVKPFASFKPGVNPAYAWEPVIWRGGRNRTRRDGTIRDWHSANITLKKGLPGAKPESFCVWICALLNFRDGDEMVDLFPGTAVMGRIAYPGRCQHKTTEIRPDGPPIERCLNCGAVRHIDCSCEESCWTKRSQAALAFEATP